MRNSRKGREIMKFRVWDKKRKCYSEDDFSLTDKGQLLVKDASYPWQYKECSPIRFVVEHSTTDKYSNGEPVFQGDICRYVSADGDLIRAQVVFKKDESEGCAIAGFCLEEITTFHDKDISDLNEGYWFGSWEKLGNIHENPELLESPDA